MAAAARYAAHEPEINKSMNIKNNDPINNNIKATGETEIVNNSPITTEISIIMGEMKTARIKTQIT